MSDKLAGLRFLMGRLIGLTCFGVIVSLFGTGIHIDERAVNLVFGVTIIALGLYRCAALEETTIGWKLRVLKVRLGLKSSCSGRGKQVKAGFGLGLFRGLCNPGRKYLYLAPFLLDLGVFKGLAVSFVYGVSSSVYLLLGFVSAGIINTMTPHKKLLTLSGGIILVLVGGYYIWKSKGLIL